MATHVSIISTPRYLFVLGLHSKGFVAWRGNQNLMASEKLMTASENHRIIKGWKRLLRSSSPTINPTPPCLL